VKPHYLEQETPDADDIFLSMAKGQGYVPQGCLLGGESVMAEVHSGNDPCSGCECDRVKCGGRRKHERMEAARVELYREFIKEKEA